jgi:hypothetical protein
MRKQDGLSVLQVREAGDNDVPESLRPLHQGLLALRDETIHFIYAVPRPQSHVERDLVISAASRVEPQAAFADPLDQRSLDVHVDVFVSLFEFKGPAFYLALDLQEGFPYQHKLGLRDESAAR